MATVEPDLSILDAAARGINRLRLPEWTTPGDHIQIDIVDGHPGPWLSLWSPFNIRCNGRDPVRTLLADQFARIWLAYDGPVPDSDEYRAALMPKEADHG